MTVPEAAPRGPRARGPVFRFAAFAVAQAAFLPIAPSPAEAPAAMPALA